MNESTFFRVVLTLLQYASALDDIVFPSIGDCPAPMRSSTTASSLPPTNPTNTSSQYTNQSRGGTGVRSWADRKDPIVDTDLVVFVQFGINHVSPASPFALHLPLKPSNPNPTITNNNTQVPRIEDFPVMPCEILKVSFKPVNFFARNPAIDVPPSTQEFNKSTLLASAHQQGAEVVAEVGGDGCVGCEKGGGSKL